jgi:mannose-1-phosphate guanylyltransferase/mannose-6-phosphate isomerase
MYDWNSGMFLFKASVYLAALELHQPAIYSACVAAMNAAVSDSDFIRPEAEAFVACPDDSVDYAIMDKAVVGEGASSVVVIPMDCGWSDVGSWSALWDVAEKDEQGNALRGDVLLEDCSNCLLQSQGKLVAAVGLDNVVVVETDDAIMVACKDRVQDVKKIVAQLKRSNRNEAVANRKVFRPWGYYDSIDQGDRFQAKRIVVKPGGCLSLQMHHHRAEHWIVVSGTAEVTKGDDVFLVSENESTYIPLGTKHRLKNPGAIDLEMIEVQSGSYLGEDDIVRFEDTYGRS